MEWTEWTIIKNLYILSIHENHYKIHFLKFQKLLFLLTEKPVTPLLKISWRPVGVTQTFVSRSQRDIVVMWRHRLTLHHRVWRYYCVSYSMHTNRCLIAMYKLFFVFVNVPLIARQSCQNRAFKGIKNASRLYGVSGMNSTLLVQPEWFSLIAESNRIFPFVLRLLQNLNLFSNLV